MEAIKSNQMKRLHTLLHKTGLMDAKRDLIFHYTNGRTTSARELMADECDNLIDHLLETDPRQKMIRKVFALAYDLGIIYSGNEDDKKMNKVALDAWLKRRSYLHKPLNEYQTNELPKLVSQMMTTLKHNAQSDARKEAKESVDDLLNELGIQSK